MFINKCQGCGSILEPGVRRCPRCGFRTAMVQDAPTPARSGDTAARMLWVVVVILVAGSAWLLLRESSGPRHADSGTSTPGLAMPAPRETPLSIWPVLESKYPRLRLHWRDSRGRRYVAVPRLFWDSMLPSERARFARELDLIFPERDWTVVTGNYWGGPLMQMEERHARAALLDDEVPETTIARVQNPTPQPVTVPAPSRPVFDTPPPSPPPPENTGQANRQADRPDGVPEYELLFTIDSFHSDRRYGEILVPSLSPRTGAGELRRVARAIAELERLDALTLYCTAEARRAHYSMDYADQNPEALDDGLLGSLERGRFVPHRPRR